MDGYGLVCHHYGRALGDLKTMLVVQRRSPSHEAMPRVRISYWNVGYCPGLDPGLPGWLQLSHQPLGASTDRRKGGIGASPRGSSPFYRHLAAV